MKAQQRVSVFSLAVGLLCLSAAGVFASQRSATNPGSGYLLAALALGVFGTLQLIQSLVLWRIARRVPEPPDRDEEVERFGGPFDLAGGRPPDIRREYVVRITAPMALSVATFTMLLFAVSALRVSQSLMAGVIGAGIGIVFAGYLLWANRRSSVIVGPEGLTRRGPWRARTTLWADVVSAGFERGGYAVRYRKPGSAPYSAATTTMNLSVYARIPANASMPRLIGLYVGGLPPSPPSPAAAAPPPSLRRAGIAIRSGAWMIDVVLLSAIIFIGAVFVDLVMAAFHRGVVVPADAGPALWIAAIVTIPTYLIVGWHIGHTAGMALLRLRVIDASTGTLPTWRQSAVRFVAALPSMVLGVPLGLLFALGSERLALHDRIAGTAVVSTASHSVALPQLGLPES